MLGYVATMPGELFPKSNDNSVAILLTYGTARVLIAGDIEAREESLTKGAYMRPLLSSGFESTNCPELLFYLRTWSS